ncbi:MAG: UbiD family decarboxylase, partial [Nitrososphaerota archaeon]
MTFKDLRETLKAVESWGNLCRVKVPVTPELEVAEIARRVMYSRGPTLLFENIKGYPDWRMATNLFRDIDTIKKILNVEKLEEIGESLIRLLTTSPPLGFLKKLYNLYDILKLGAYAPKKVGKGLFEENVIEKDGFDKTPIPKIW